MAIPSTLRSLAVVAAAAWFPADAEAPAPEGDIYANAVAAEARPAADRERDGGRHPAEVLAFFGIEPGDTVLDLFSGGGYYAELLAYVVGPDGHVVAHTNSPYLNFVGDEFEARHANGRLPNVEVLMAENNELELAPATFDAILLVLSYHDVYHEDPESGWARIDKDALLTELYDSLVPGGLLGIVDHAAAPGSPPETGHTLHRIDPAVVKSDLKVAGFVLDGESDLLANPDDDRTTLVFDPSIRGRTDRFILRFRKPG
ncbi:MAG TPA: hypothetical protein VFY03_00525 [Woeseiaceae bacterium]|nr:hypothetical protein [Woeseiaceae bacterium]